jgi:hypothetical protein
LIVSLAIVFVTTQGSSSSYMHRAWADQPLTLDNIIKNYYVKIQDISENGQDATSETGQDSESDDETGSSGNETGSGLAGQALSSGNETGSGLAGQALSSGNETGSGEALSSEEDTEVSNQTSTEATSESESNENINENTVTQQQTQNNNQTVNIQNNVEMKQRLEVAISEEEGEAPISIEEQTRIESVDRDIVTQHKSLTGPDCKTGDVLAGASNVEDLRVLTECQEATGIVMHTKKMDDGDYKFFLKLDDQFKFLTNEKNDDKTDGFLVVEIVPPDQGKSGVILPKEGDRVHVWGAWVTDKPKGWHEIHPTWKVVNE